MILEDEIAQLKEGKDHRDQYNKQTCLRIKGLPVLQRETCNECLEKVISIFNAIGLQIPDSAQNRAHRLGNLETISLAKLS